MHSLRRHAPRRAVVRIRIPGRLVVLVGLVAPIGPARPCAAREEFEVGAFGAGLDQLILFIGFARVFAFAGLHHVDLAAARSQCSRGFTAHAEKQNLGDIAEIEADTAPVGAAVFPDLVPHDIFQSTAKVSINRDISP